MQVSEIVNQQLYPILDEGGPKLVAASEKGKKDYIRDGFAILPSFLTAAAVEATTRQIEDLKKLAHVKEQVLRSFVQEGFAKPDDCFEYACKLGYLAGDQLGDNVVLQALHDSDDFLRLIESIVNMGSLYRLDDPLASMSLAIFSSMDYLHWHLDQTDFVVYLVLSDCEAGGDHQIIDVKKTEEDYDFDTINDAIAGENTVPRSLPLSPGSLVVFNGRRLLHRITPVSGQGNKIISIFFFSSNPGTVASEALRKARFGRLD